MIYTVTLNPSLDYVMQLSQFKAGLTNRSQFEELYVGGKGINVSMVLKQLNQPTTVLGLIAGFTGEAIQAELSRLEIPNHLVPLANGLSRINVKLKGEDETEINGAGPTVTKADFEQLLECIKQMDNEDFLILSGSVPPGLDCKCYIEMMQIATQKGVRVVVDAAGETLQQCLAYQPFLVKPNRQELEELLQLQLDPNNKQEIIQAAKLLQQKGAINVLVSLGGDGSLLLDETKTVYHMEAAKGQPINTVGAGDSMIAGFITGIVKQNDYAFALRLGTACGGATAFSKGLADSVTINHIFDTLSSAQQL